MTNSTSRLVEERNGVRLVILPHSQLGCGDLINYDWVIRPK
jgi:hypothetical protein